MEEQLELERAQREKELEEDERKAERKAEQARAALEKQQAELAARLKEEQRAREAELPLAHEQIDVRTSESRRIYKIRLTSSKAANLDEDQLAQVALQVDGEPRALFWFYLREMASNGRPWAVATVRPESRVDTKIFPDRAPQ